MLPRGSLGYTPEFSAVAIALLVPAVTLWMGFRRFGQAGTNELAGLNHLSGLEKVAARGCLVELSPFWGDDSAKLLDWISRCNNSLSQKWVGKMANNPLEWTAGD